MKLQEVAGLYVRLFSGGYVAMVDDNVVGMSMQKFENSMELIRGLPVRSI